jgi:AraC-like DNA-binding protein
VRGPGQLRTRPTDHRPRTRQLLTKIRIEAAAKARRDDREPLSTVAAACGFYDQAVLTRQFRELTGVPPGEYRRALRSVA